ncbi:MAG: hypothetical protein ABR881_32580 [Candidatus Sulfotelmatobacter sp.]|jgi:hypothetical protein
MSETVELETIVIRTANPRDITIEEAGEIASALRTANPGVSVKTEGQERTGFGVTWFEVLRITLLGGAFGLGKAFAEEVVKKVADIFVEWARERFKGRKSNSKRPVYLAIYGPDGLLKSLLVKNAMDAPEDRTAEDLGRTSANRAKVEENATPTPKTENCGGEHLCPICRQRKPCALGVCNTIGDVACDSCIYVEEYGPKAAAIIEKAIAVAAKLDDASCRLAQFLPEHGPQPWATREEARVWMNEATTALEELDTTIGRIQLRFRARYSAKGV